MCVCKEDAEGCGENTYGRIEMCFVTETTVSSVDFDSISIVPSGKI